MRDAFLLGEANQRVGDVLVREVDDLRAEIAGHALVLLEALEGLRVAVALVVIGPGDVDGVPVGRKAAGHARADAHQPLRTGPSAEADHDLLGNRRLLEALRAAVVGGALAYLLGGGAQRQLAQHVQIALAEEVGKRLLDLFRRVDLALAQARAQLVHGDVDVNTSSARLKKLSGTVSRMTVLAERFTASFSVSRC